MGRQMKKMLVYVDASVVGCDHMVNLGRIRLFNAVSMEKGYRPIEIRSPKEMLLDEEEI